MSRIIRYQQIAADLSQRVEADEFAPGRVLPSEAALGAHYQASRVTIRKALEVLRAAGLVESRQGFGWLVVGEPIPQVLGGLATIEAQLGESGREAERRIEDFSFTDSPPSVAPHLGPRVLEVKRVNLADGEPFARVTVWCREDLGTQLSKADVARTSFYDLLPVQLGGATQRIGAALMSADDARLLNVPEGSAALVVRRVTHASNGEPVLVADHVFPSHLTEFVIDLPGNDLLADADPAGLRLVVD